MTHSVFEDDLIPYVRGGGKIVLLVSRDLERLNGACIRLSKEEYSGRNLYRWEGDGEPLKKRVGKHWEIANDCDGNPLNALGCWDDCMKEFILFYEDALLWLPLSQPFLVEDGGEGVRDGKLLKRGMDLAKFALGEEVDNNNSKHEGNWPGKTIILGGMEAKLPTEIKSATHTIRWDFPSRAEIRELLTGDKGQYVNEVFEVEKSGNNVAGSILHGLGLLEEWNNQMIDESVIENMIRASQGLDLKNCKVVLVGAIQFALDRDGIISKEEVNYVREQKVRMISDGGDGLLSIENTDHVDEIVGLEGLRKWIDRKIQLFRNPGLAAKHGVKHPRGILLTGVPGCGKSLSAKTVAIQMELPLLGFDLGTITDSAYGQTEENMHRALKQAESMAPCVLWIDEFEKMFASANEGATQGHEVTQRVNGIFLKWMEERKDGVFVVATSNDLSGIKAEYRRSGRWDGTFFFDLPSKNERIAILTSNLKKFQSVGGHTLTDAEIENVANMCESWASSDLAGLIKEAKDISFNERSDGNLAPVKMEHVERAREFITPLCKLDSKRLNSIRRAGANGKMTPASLYEDGDVTVDLAPETSSDAVSKAIIDLVRKEKQPDDEDHIFE